MWSRYSTQKLVNVIKILYTEVGKCDQYRVYSKQKLVNVIKILYTEVDKCDQDTLHRSW